MNAFDAALLGLIFGVPVGMLCGFWIAAGVGDENERLKKGAPCTRN